MSPRRRHRLAHAAAHYATSLWCLWPLTTTAAGAIVTVLIEQLMQRGIPLALGALSGFILGAVEAALIINRRPDEDAQFPWRP